MADTGVDANGRPTDNRTLVLYCIIGTLVPFMVLVEGLRIYSRKVLTNVMGPDDWVSLISMCLIIAMSTTMWLMTKTGMGYHKYTLNDAQLFEYNRLFYIDIAFYIAVLGTIKLQILLQYYRVFAIKMRKVTIWVTVIVCIWSLGSWLGCIFACNPVQGWWDPSVKAVCLPTLPQWYFNAAGNIATDLTIFALPVPILWKLNLPLAERMSLLFIFCIGFFTCCISMVRITALSQPADDNTYDNIVASGWSVGETCGGMIVSCLPTLRPMLARAIRPFRRTKNETPVFGPRPVHTFGGGYIDHSGNRQQGKGSSGGRSKGKNASRSKASDTLVGSTGLGRGSSTEELTATDDIELALGVGMKNQTATEKALAAWESHEVNMNGSDGDAEALPIQRPSPSPSPSPPPDALGRSASGRAHRHRLSGPGQQPEEEVLGLRAATMTTIHGGSGDLDVGNSGIQVQRDVTQRYGQWA